MLAHLKIANTPDVLTFSSQIQWKNGMILILLAILGRNTFLCELKCLTFHVTSQHLLLAAATYSGVVWGGWLGALNTAQNCCCHKNLKRAPKCGRSPGYGQPPTEHRWVGAMPDRLPEQREQALRAGICFRIFFSALL